MSYLIDRLVQRLIVEQSWDIVLDTDEVPPLPGEDILLERLEAETDEDASDRLLLQYFETLARHVNSAPLIGGPLPDFTDVSEVEGSPVNIAVVLPALRTLKPYCRRIVTKLSGLNIRVCLFIDGSVAPELTREKLVSVGKVFRDDMAKAAAAEESASLPENTDKATSKSRRKKEQPISITFELIQVGDRIDTRSAREALRQRRCTFNRKDRIFIHGTLIDSATNQAWSTSGLGGYQRRRNLRYALTHSDQSPADIREALKNRRFNWQVVLVAVIVALAGTSLSYYLQLQGSPKPLVMFASDILIPLVVILTAVSFNRVHDQTARQTKWFLIGYFSVYLAVWCWLVWPVSFSFIMYLAKVTFLVWITSMFASLLMELE